MQPYKSKGCTEGIFLSFCLKKHRIDCLFGSFEKLSNPEYGDPLVVMSLENAYERLRGDYFVGILMHQGKDLVDRRRRQSHPQPDVVKLIYFLEGLALIYIHQ